MNNHDRSFLYGDGLFETVRVRRGGSIRWFPQHVKRILGSGRALGYPKASLHDAVEALHEFIGSQAGLWRVTISRKDSEAPFGGHGGVATRFRAYTPPMRADLGIAQGFYLPDDFLAEHKTTSYLRNVEARRRAKIDGFDDAVMVSKDGLVGEAAAANIVVVSNGVASTPPIRGILPGVTRAGVLELAEAHGEPIEVREISLNELREADEIAMMSAGIGVIAAASLDGRELDDSWSRRVGEWLP
jgi:branched-subunit amino acid aminotransferase/4-amino-4-deoxychorismate lyase